ncbi:hypothetical protein IC582_003131 [Cucumis melo]|uniref:Leucine-rich repeat, cysteine-containing subtype n=2 Tax=Cucumis melo TaxID=3656 RepID=A0A5A7UQM3_CUCMM|nr:uncharacterized protein LOC103492366 [Cucumis melo]KAA0055779.1 Leucine-rich repeat, cysteine-containing subtype [Cucumis melo var. makuwa]TYK10030.1 Leucine-rich repeat, cysteine-containing subtype [Cucumis melo var. makuwa]
MTVLRSREVISPPPTPKSLKSPSDTSHHSSTPSQHHEIQPLHSPTYPSPVSTALSSDGLSSPGVSRRRSFRLAAKGLSPEHCDVDRVRDNSPGTLMESEMIDNRDLGLASDGKLVARSICDELEGFGVNEGTEGLDEFTGSKSDEVNVNGKRKLNPTMDSPAGEWVDESSWRKECLSLRWGKRKTMKQGTRLKGRDNVAIDPNGIGGILMKELNEECSRIEENDCTNSRNRFSRKEKGKWIVDDRNSNRNDTAVLHSEPNDELSDNLVKHQNYRFVRDRLKGVVIEENTTNLSGASYYDGGDMDANGHTAIEGDASEHNVEGRLIAEALLSLSADFMMDSNSRYKDISIEGETSGPAHLVHDGPQSNDRQEMESSSEEIAPFDLYLRRRTAIGFARYNGGNDGSQNVEAESEDDIKDWPGPFSTAMKIASDRANGVRVRVTKSLEENDPAPVKWIPKKRACCRRSQSLPPSLGDLCVRVLAENADAISSLDFVPDTFRHKLSRLLCDSRKMDSRFLNLLLCGSPTEVCIRDCSWLSEEEFVQSFQGCDTSKLIALQLYQCGRSIFDIVLLSTLARSSNSLPALKSLSLTGACSLSDVGVAALVCSAPALQSLNLSQCSFLTFSSIDSIANSLGSTLRELYLDDCLKIDPMLMLPAMNKLQHLEVLSLAGMEDVCDKFIQEFLTAGGRNLKELILTDCVKLTNKSIKAISETCSALRAIDLMNLSKLTDYALCCLASGCQALQKLKLSRNLFSDEAVAAFVEMSRENLKELSLNSVKKVSRCTAISLACFCKNLVSLDVSWCRKLTDEALGLIVDNCPSLRELKLFGCTQVTDVFLDGHSNPNLEIIGLKLTPVWQIEPHIPCEGSSYRSSVPSSS